MEGGLRPNFENSPLPDEISAARKLVIAESLMKFEDPSNHLQELSKRIQEGALPIIVSNHDHHANVAGMMGIVRRLTARPNKFNFPVAFSMFNGDQGQEIQKNANGMKPILEKSGMPFIPVLRPKDIKEYYGEGKKSDAQKEIDIKESNRNLFKMLKEIKDDTGVILFPEGTIQGGRKDDSGNKFGMQKVDNDLLATVIEMAIKNRRVPVILPVGMVNTDRIVEPGETSPTLRAKLAFGTQIAVGRIGIHPTVAGVRIGNLITQEDFQKNGIDFGDKENVTSFVMRRIAELVPEEARGAYK